MKLRAWFTMMNVEISLLFLKFTILICASLNVKPNSNREHLESSLTGAWQEKAENRVWRQPLVLSICIVQYIKYIMGIWEPSKSPPCPRLQSWLRCWVRDSHKWQVLRGVGWLVRQQSSWGPLGMLWEHVAEAGTHVGHEPAKEIVINYFHIK